MKRPEIFDGDIMDLAREKIKASSLGVARVPVPVLAPVAGQVSVWAQGRGAVKITGQDPGPGKGLATASALAPSQAKREIQGRAPAPAPTLGLVPGPDQVPVSVPVPVPVPVLVPVLRQWHDGCPKIIIASAKDTKTV